MNAIQKKRLSFIVALLVLIAFVVGLSLYALKQNIDLFYTPVQVAKGEVKPGYSFHLGGKVQKGSVKWDEKRQRIFFVVGDQPYSVKVEYEGVLPDLFREGQTVVIEGSLNHKGMMQAKRVLAKHDERYQPVPL